MVNSLIGLAQEYGAALVSFVVTLLALFGQALLFVGKTAPPLGAPISAHFPRRQAFFALV
jgi:hypothetical protein